MPSRELHFRIDTDLAAGALVQALDENDLFLEGVDAKLARPSREAPRIDRLAGLRIEALDDAQLAELCPREVDRVEAAVRTLPSGKARGDVRGAVQRDVMLHDQHAVLGEDQVLFEVVGALRVSQRLGSQRMLRQIPAGATVGDDRRAGLSSAERSSNEEAQQTQAHFTSACRALASASLSLPR